MTRPFVISLAAVLSLLTVTACGADEPDSVTHNEPVTVQVLSGKNGQPLGHSHLILIAGYDQGEIHDQLWREETLTDAQGKAKLSKQFVNLPWLQVWVDKKPLCQAAPHKTSFSVERILRDGLSAPNRCGIFTVEDVPGIFTVFVMTGKKDAKSSMAVSPAPETTPAAPIAVETHAYKPVHPLPAVTLTVTAPKIDLPEQTKFSLPASAPVVVSADKPVHAEAQRPIRRVATYKARRRGLRRAERTLPTRREQKSATKPATLKAPAKTVNKAAQEKGKTTQSKTKAAKIPAKKVNQKPRPAAAGNKPAANAKPTSPNVSPKKK